MITGNNKNIGHSIFQRLLNKAKADKEDFNLLLTRYGMERFLYRFGVSTYRDKFILKGASLFLVWMGQNYRVTRDADFLGFGSPDSQNLSNIFRDICEIECDSDGMIYHADTLKVEEIREEQEYGGVRVTLKGSLNKAVISLQIDIGFGDAITPEPEDVEFPTLLALPSPKLKAYPRYTLVAEKLEAMVHLGLGNSRMKDFYDIWLLSTLFSFNGDVLRTAVKNTFNRRGTSIPNGVPFAFTPEFYEDQQKQIQWKAFVRKAKPDYQSDGLSKVVGEIAKFLQPVIDSLHGGSDFEQVWKPELGWSEIA